MISPKIRTILQPIMLLGLISIARAHPTGNMITVGDHVLWSYINPIEDPNHRACIMIWEKGTEPKVFIQSEYSGSDYMLYNKQNEIYLIERRQDQTSQAFEIRILKTAIDRKSKVIWPWFKDDSRIGEGGFFMVSDHEVVFGSYPNLYSLKKGGEPKLYLNLDSPVKRIRALANNQILVLGDQICYLVDKKGAVLKKWDNLINTNAENAPLNRNQIFDMDYKHGNLLLANWGNRSFDIIDAQGKRRTLQQQTEPLAPHWVAFWENEKLLFSSKLIFDGSSPKPYLLSKSETLEQVIWEQK